jgi:carbamoyltransferase
LILFLERKEEENLIILGVTHPMVHNNAACLLVDGELVAMVEEERFNRMKHSPGVPPNRSIQYCLDLAKIGLDDVDFYAVGWDQATTLYPSFKLRRYAVNNHHMNRFPFGRRSKKIRYVNHHFAHAVSAYYLSGFQGSNIISLDASGGNESGILAVGRGDDIEIVKMISNDSSWGFFYSYITGILGFQAHSHEGKTMGLAPYGTPDPEAFDFIRWDREIPEIDRPGMKQFVASVEPRKKGEPLNQRHKDLAASAQYTLERAGTQMSEYLYRRSGIKNLCLAGGCALNCSMNGKLFGLPHVDHIFIQPAAHDSGTALGAAVQVHREMTGSRPQIRFNHALWGPEYSNGEIEEILKRSHVSRSILADPRTIEIKDVLNKNVKGREPWRPFAPSFLAEDFTKYVENPYNSPFMIIAFQGKDGIIENIQGAAHVDHTVRVQTVERSIQPKYWDAINAFKKLTGVPAVLNTSFNVAGQPMVCTPFDALSTFFACGLDYLAMGDFLVWK